MIANRRWQFAAPVVLALLLLSSAAARDITPATTNQPVLQVDPVLLGEAAEVWTVIAAANNPIWPDWNASSTPLLFYLPGKQDVLINHPHPPTGFVPYDGAVRFPGSRIFVKNGPGLVDWDGQNTSKDVAGVRTLVVADTLSNLRSRVSGLLQDTRPADEKVQKLAFADLATDPYDQLALVVHEAFHVFQDTHAPDKAANEMFLLQYPVLSVSNNVAFAQEGAALAQALRAADAALLRAAALRWLALRRDRRSKLPQNAVRYEDGTEFYEGLAKYTEYRLAEVLEGRRPGPAMWWAQGFTGYTGLEWWRKRLMDSMLKNMNGSVVVNNNPYGTGSVRMRLYYSGMGIAAMLDRLSPDWKRKIFLPQVSLTSLVDEAVKASQGELEEALRLANSEPGYAALVTDKQKLAREGEAHTLDILQQIEEGPGIGLVVDYSNLASAQLGIAFTPFGITRIDADRVIFAQVPIKVAFGKNGELAQKMPAPLLRDSARKLIRFRLPVTSKVEVGEALGGRDAAVGQLSLELPAFSLKAARARVQWSGNDLIVTLLEADTAPQQN